MRRFWRSSDSTSKRVLDVLYRLDLDVLKMYLYTKNELSRPRLSKVSALQTDRQTHRCGRKHVIMILH